jgi:hypothetical protein
MSKRKERKRAVVTLYISVVVRCVEWEGWKVDWRKDTRGGLVAERKLI